jgi:ubiquinone/menaquinone biosynthesis C-methylase UbiE
MKDRDLWGVAAGTRLSERWATASAGWNMAMTDALLAAAELNGKSVVLDLAAGSGEPALTIARRLAAGGVVALDSSRPGLLLAKKQAAQLGVSSKISFIQADAHALPLAEACVDRITCRCGVMFFSETTRAMSEAFRVLKPGGRVALLAWAQFEQPFFEATIGTVLRLVPGAEIPDSARLMFRFASAGALESTLRQAGFHDVQEARKTLPRIWAGSPQELWEYQQEVSTLSQPLFDAIPLALRPKVDAEVSSALACFRSGKILSVPAQVVLAIGVR